MRIKIFYTQKRKKLLLINICEYIIVYMQVLYQRFFIIIFKNNISDDKITKSIFNFRLGEYGNKVIELQKI